MTGFRCLGSSVCRGEFLLEVGLARFGMDRIEALFRGTGEVVMG